MEIGPGKVLSGLVRRIAPEATTIAIDDITTVRPADLEISGEGNEIVIAFAYRKEVPLFANVGMYIYFAASSRGQ